MRRLTAALAPLLLPPALLALAACGDDGGGAPATDVTVVVADLAVGQTYEDPTGAVTVTVHAVEAAGDLLVADAEACTREEGPAAIPVETRAWQLRVAGREAAVTRSVLEPPPPPAARPPWPARLALGNGECFRGKVPFELPAGAEPTTVVFTQLGRPVTWSISR